VAGTPVEHGPLATSESPSWSGPENTVPGEQGMEEEEGPGEGLGANPGCGSLSQAAERARQHPCDAGHLHAPRPSQEDPTPGSIQLACPSGHCPKPCVRDPIAGDDPP